MSAEKKKMKEAEKSVGTTISGATIGGPDWKKNRDLAGAALDKILDWGFQPINSFRFATELWSRQQERFVSAGSYRWIKSPTR